MVEDTLSRRDEIKRLVSSHSRRLQKLKERQALSGISTDPSVLLEIEDIEATLESLQTMLGEPVLDLSSTQVHPERPQKLENPYTFGVPVSSNEFFGREQELKLIFNTLENVPFGQKQDMVIMGPRRIGKSSLLYQLVDLLTQNIDFIPVYVDIQHIKPRKTNLLFFEILESIKEGYERQNLQDTLPLFKTVVTDSIPSALEYYTFKKDLSALNKSIAEHKLPRLVLMFDEVELLTEFGGQDTLDWFRALIQSSLYTIFVVAGTERLYALTQDYGSPFYNIFKTIELHALTTDAARALVKVPADQIGMEITEAEIDKILYYSGNTPYFVQGMCHYLVEWLNQQERLRAYPEDVERIIERSVDTLSSQFAYIWGGRSQIERAILYTLAEAREAQTDKELLAASARFGYYIRSKQEELEIFNNLTRQQILKQDKNEGYWFVVPLFMDWILSKIEAREIFQEPDDARQAPKVNTAMLRRFFTTSFDDTSLDAFMFDYFPSVYDRSSRGMRKDEKITLLLDHVRRQPEEFDTLLTSLREEQPEQFATIEPKLYR